MLKAQLHAHCKGDPWDKIKYTAKQLIDHAADKGFDVLAITCHNKVVYNQGLSQYAKDRNILLIPGVEKTVQGKHVLIYNTQQEDVDKINSFQDLRKLKREKDPLVIAPHPFFVTKDCLKGKIIDYLDLFDAWEFSYYYTKLINPNKKMVRLAKKYGKPMMGSSDVHDLTYIDKTYTQIDADKNIESVIKAIRQGRTRVVTKPLSLDHFLRIGYKLVRKDL